MEDLNPTKREEEFLRGIKLAASGEDSSVPTPVWDYEKRLYDIWLAAKGEDPIYNLPVHTEHPDAFYNAIRDALVEGGGGGGGSPLGSVTIVNNTSQEIGVTGVEKGNDGAIYSRATHIESGESGEVFMIPAYGSTAESVEYVSDCLEINMNQNAVVDDITLTGSDTTIINKIGMVTNKRFVVAFEVYAPVGTILTFSNGTADE